MPGKLLLIQEIVAIIHVALASSIGIVIIATITVGLATTIGWGTVELTQKVLQLPLEQITAWRAPA